MPGRQTLAAIVPEALANKSLVSKNQERRGPLLNSTSDPPELSHGLPDRPEFFDEGQHLVLRVVERLGFLENFSGAGALHDGNAILVGHDHVSWIDFDAGAGHRNVGAGEPVM